MFLQWIAKCELVAHSPDSYVLKKFSEKCQRSMCSLVVGFLSADNVDIADVLPSAHHIRWAMEIIGHSFALNMDDAEVIAGAIRIYERWLGIDANVKTKDQRPASMQKVEQSFIQDILGQMTLLFEERADSSRSGNDSSITKQVQLCSRVLDIFEAVAKRRGSQLSPQTWDRMIRLLLGAADGILHTSRSVIGNHLCGSLVRILFELYLRSLVFCGPRGELWNLLQKFYRRWIHRLLVIEQWNAVSIALTRSLMRHLQTQENSKEVEIAWTENRLQSKVELDPSLMTYAWYRLIRVVGHPSGFSDPEVFLTAIKGVSRLADEFMKREENPVVEWEDVLGALTTTIHKNRENQDAAINAQAEKRKKQNQAKGSAVVERVRSPPDVNTILRLLGPWLFDASLSRSQRFAACRSEALKCLGKLVCDFSGGRSKRIHWAYAVRSLMAVQGALLEEDDRIVASAVYTWSKVFGLYGNHTLRGAAVLTGPFHRAVERILRITERMGLDEPSIGGIPVILLRRACIEACSSLLTLHTHLPRGLVKEAEKTIVQASMAGIPGLLSTLPKYTSSQVVALLMNAIKIESDPTNLQMVLWLLTVAIQQEASLWSTGMASSRNSQVPVTILLLCSMISKAARYKPPVMFTLFECLRHLTLVWNELYYEAMNSVIHLVNACCDFIIASTPVLRTNRAPFFLDELMAAAYQCITEWVVAAPFLLSKQQVMTKIVNTVLDTNDKTGSLAANNSALPVREASQKLLSILMKHHSTYADNEGLNEKVVLAEVCGKENADANVECRFFSLNKKSILTVIEKPATAQSPTPETILIMRDASGRYVWRTKPRFKDGQRLTNVREYETYSEDKRADGAADNESFTESELSDDDDIALAQREEANSKDPLLQALRSTHQASSLMSWQTATNATGADATPTPPSAAIQAGEGNTGLTSVIERKAAAVGREERDRHESLFAGLLSAQSRADRDAASLSSMDGQSIKRCIKPEQPEKDSALESWEISRRMMTELGFLSVRNWGSVFAMKSGSSGSLLFDLEELDMLRSREAFEFGIAYVLSRGSEGGFDNVHVVSSADIDVGITTVSRDYQMFLRSLGERVDLSDSNGLAADATTSRFDGEVLYHAHHGGDACFYVPTLPVKYRDNQSYVDPVDLLERSNVLIVWNESQLNYTPGTMLWESTFRLPKPSSHVIIIIDPLGNDLYCVRISHDGSPLFNQRDVISREDDNYVDEGEVHCARVLGPLQDGMVVNGAWLAPLVRQTATNAAVIARAYQLYQASVGGANAISSSEGSRWSREHMITAIVEKYMRPQLPGEFYGGLFSDVAKRPASAHQERLFASQSRKRKPQQSSSLISSVTATRHSRGHFNMSFFSSASKSGIHKKPPTKPVRSFSERAIIDHTPSMSPSTDPEPPNERTMEGFLWLRVHVRRRRYCVLQGRILHVYNSQEEAARHLEPGAPIKKKIVVVGVKDAVELEKSVRAVLLGGNTSSAALENALVISTLRSKLIAVEAETYTEKQRWLHAMSCLNFATASSEKALFLTMLQDSSFFDAHVAVTLLHRYRDNPVAVDLIIDRLSEYAEHHVDDVEFYIQQIMHLVVNLEMTKTDKLVHLLLSICKAKAYVEHLGNCIHLALQLFWLLEAKIRDKEPKTYNLCAKLLMSIEAKVVNQQFEIPAASASPDAISKLLMQIPGMRERLIKMKQSTVQQNETEDHTKGTEHQPEDTSAPESKPETQDGDEAKMHRDLLLQWMEKERQKRYRYFHDQRDFVRALTDISEKMRLTEPPQERKKHLPAELTALIIPQMAYIPLGRVSDPFCRIARVLTEEGTVFSTHSRAPCLVCFEVIQDQVNAAGQRASFTRPKSVLSPRRSSSMLVTRVSTNSDSSSVASLVDEEVEVAGYIKKYCINGKYIVVEGEAHAEDAVNEDEDIDIGTFIEVEQSVSVLSPREDEQAALHVLEQHLGIAVMPVDAPSPRGDDQANASSSSIKANALVDESAGSLSSPEEHHQLIRHRSKEAYEFSLAKLMTDGGAFGERWSDKKERIRKSSPHGHLPGWNLVSLISKSNDDIRQEVFAMQLITKFQDIFQDNNLQLWLRPYRIVSTGKTTGLIETITDAQSLDSLKKREGYQSLRVHFERTYGKGDVNSREFKTAQRNFLHSLVAYSIVCYLLHIKDRHNGNIMLDTEGHLIHIDFGFMLGIAPGGNWSLETAPFKLTKEMVEVLGGIGSKLFGEFVQLFALGTLAAQRNAEKIITLVEIMMRNSTFPCFQGRDVSKELQKLRDRFMLHYTTEQIVKAVMKMIGTSYKNKWTKRYDQFQKLTNGIVP
ncbi:hypothetical protein Poli38472_006021 [Pythium oligandrum]|uniref:1-phosphatidylinositol 4-kinase n=1 Tax=Pythium oligandrum TaxID=41045 RepID=A0A8K1CTB5_PYTOL|nr:hypothetical protein Poli38472_006021 [Pythium oligandrum]|eukprot:TMW68553.1 hypothetical protein Poli38472_006021 [Pythium oligandrum]